ncbi:hypothetical protein DF3PA_50121 [Candidatus Defluviicoccus seviourii]|uniref:Uncharacterized protein n=2 Tax=root TaxID=1 RepID=A0A564WIT5_9PROT|nr:hypothetical protein DF3PB_3180003 [uncultured Defluviicoccus sp.]VUX47474.1 hypothetical protein DF3PA_50121 [Candidatus Defluviicoccus seviourii]
MARRITDLTAAELDVLARDAWAHEAESSLQQGLPVTYMEDGNICRRWPDGRCECIATKVATKDEAGSARPPDDDQRDAMNAAMPLGEPMSKPKWWHSRSVGNCPAAITHSGSVSKPTVVTVIAPSGGRRRRDKANTADD